MESTTENPRTADDLLSLAREIAAMGPDLPAEGVRLARKVSLLIHLLEEIRHFGARNGGLAPPPEAATSSAEASLWTCVSELGLALEGVKRFLLLGRWQNHGQSFIENSDKKSTEIQYQYVTWNLEKVLANVPYECFEISDEVLEEVELVRAQLRRETEKKGIEALDMFEEIYKVLNYAQAGDIKEQFSFKLEVEKSEIAGIVDHDVRDIVVVIAEIFGISNYDAERLILTLMERHEQTLHTNLSKRVKAGEASTNLERSKVEDKSRDSLVIPEDFRCPISLELMRDPVIVSTGQTYERSFIQRWIDCGNRTCPKTQQKLENLTLTTNYVLRSLILQWCETNGIEQPYRSTTGGIRHARNFDNITEDASMINVLVSKLASGSVEEKRSAAAEIRSLAKRSTDNRILIAESGAIPVLISLLQVDDKKTQEHAVTSLLNLSIYDHNKEAIMLAGAILPIIDVLRGGSMEARENAAASIFSLSLIDENKITIGGTPGAIDALVELLVIGSPRGQKDAATALFNLCIYPGNKPRAVRAGILSPLLRMLKDSSACGMVDEILTILSVLVGHQEGKAAISKANAIPLLIDLLRTGQPRNKENATAILLALCKKDNGNLACIARLGAVIPLTEVAKSGTERAKRKASSLLEHLEKLQIF
ncbi:U-box domain-containing protein 11 [Apostasia shenzhenica]|uniref:RING-type E3 ubiquitin transferase n=1 Tax=Apostasia shenzhenica TaxID=1088818 RepID=A0A2I0BBF7_9ASPA|nr:U-box domain-containing protein 11 [Apostasia shenzhenica]